MSTLLSDWLPGLLTCSDSADGLFSSLRGGSRLLLPACPNIGGHCCECDQHRRIRLRAHRPNGLRAICGASLAGRGARAGTAPAMAGESPGACAATPDRLRALPGLALDGWQVRSGHRHKRYLHSVYLRLHTFIIINIFLPDVSLFYPLHAGQARLMMSWTLKQPT